MQRIRYNTSKMSDAHEKLAEIASDFQEKTFTKNGQTFFYLVANESAKKMVVLVHGVTGNKLDMAVVGRAYVRRGYAVYAPDLPAHGKAPAISLSSFDDLGNWLKSCIEATHRVPDILIGNSFAAAICYNFAQQGYLRQKTHLILACPTPTIARISRLLRKASSVLPSSFATNRYNSRLGIYVRVHYLSRHPNVSARQWLVESEYHKIPFIDAENANAIVMLLDTHNPYLGVRLPVTIQKQVTVIIGTKDNVVTRQSLPLLRRLLPEARFIIVPGVGHILHFEAHHELGNVKI